jgi:hypothetical protein
VLLVVSDTEPDQRPEGEAEGDGEEVVGGGEAGHGVAPVVAPKGRGLQTDDVAANAVAVFDLQAQQVD